MPLHKYTTTYEIFFVYLSVHARWALTTYMFIKGIRWALRSNLSLVLVISLFFGLIQALLQATYFNQISLDCSNHLRLIYGAWAACTVLLNTVLYYRAWCISESKSRTQFMISIGMTAAHFLCLCFDAEYSLRIGRDLPGIGCVTIQGWPRTMYGSFATLNDLVQAKLFCDPLLRAIRNSSEVSRSTSGYRRMIMKSIICLVVCSIANITFAVLITTHREALAMMFFDIAFLFQILSACEIQFNSHKETDRASLGSVMSLRGPLQRLQELQTTLPSLFDRTASEGLQMNHEIVPSYLQTASPARQ